MAAIFFTKLEFENMTSLRASLLGEQTAEHDTKLLIPNYIETQEYRSIIETKDSTVVVGRRGTGKSAMFGKLSKFWSSQKGGMVIAIAPEDYQTIGFRMIFRPFENKYSHVRAVSRIVWRYGLLMEMLACLTKHYKSKERLSNYRVVQEELTQWKARANNFFLRLNSKLNPIITNEKDAEKLISTLYAQLNLNAIEAAFSDIFNASPVRFYILIDRLDEGYENDESGAAIISGAITAMSELNKSHERIRPVIFQRDNILRLVQIFDPDYTRNIEGEVVSIHWSTHQLQNLVSKRLNSVFDLKLENAQRIWDRCTADEENGRELRGIDGFKKCLQFTLYRPRDILSLLNQAFFVAAKEGRKTIVLKDVEVTAKQISVNRLDDLKKEYSSVIPSLPAAISTFEHGSPEMTYQEVIALLENASPHLQSSKQSVEALRDNAILGADGTLRALYSVGFLGTHDKNSNTYTFCHDGRQPDREFTEADRILVHPCYWIALNLSKNALLPDEATHINDEYEINVKSISPEVRAQRLGSLIAELGKIEPGRENAEEFEEWVARAVQTVFAGHLSNVERKPNGSAVQRRDILGTNLAKTSAWKRIEKDYNVRHVVFEVKNYKSVGRDEYRQMSTYLNGQYGSLGFLVTRDDDENLRAGSELDWVREIFQQEKKLILRITHKFFMRMLGKLRSPEKHDAVDHAVSGLLDQYERRYLSLQSTRPSKI